MDIELSPIIGHRGVPSLAPENTLGGFAKAAEVGTGWVELDVTLLGDKTPVVHHDASLDRCSNTKGPLSRLGRADLAGIDMAAKYPDWPTEPLPLLLDVLEQLHRQGTGLNLEIKQQGWDARQLVEIIVQAIKAQEFPSQRLIISSFDTRVLAECYRQAPDIARGWICNEMSDQWPLLADALQLYSIHCNWRHLSQSRVQEVKQKGYRLLCWTANHPQDVASLWHWGMDGIITDNPQDFAGPP